jgi:hypothetical protein
MRCVRRQISVGLLVVAASLFAIAPTALACRNPGGGGNQSGSGTGTVQLGPPTLIWEKPLGDSTLRQEAGSMTFSGIITGTGTLNVLALVSPSGSETFVANWNAPATVNGVSGGLQLSVLGSDNGVFSGNFIARGTGGLAGLIGQGSFSGQDATGAGTYTFRYKMAGGWSSGGFGVGGW